jgi:hypothetical protein
LILRSAFPSSALPSLLVLLDCSSSSFSHPQVINDGRGEGAETLGQYLECACSGVMVHIYAHTYTYTKHTLQIHNYIQPRLDS